MRGAESVVTQAAEKGALTTERRAAEGVEREALRTTRGTEETEGLALGRTT